MKRLMLFGGLLAVCVAVQVSAEEKAERFIPAEKVHGNYHGAFSGATWKEQTVRAEVVAQNEKMFRAVFYIGVEGDMDRVEVKGRTHDFVVDFEESVELTGKRAGKYSVTGQIKDDIFTGTMKGEKGEAAFKLEHVFIKSPTLGMAAPAGAVVLLDGTHLDKWVRVPEKWCLMGDGAMEICSSSLRTVDEYGNGKLHLEFRTPFMPDERGQARGNSGVYVFGRYEVQVLDSFGDLPMDNLCGGIYQKAVPTSMACLPPMEWQTYDIDFTAPEFDAAGKKTKDAVITVQLNGVTIHDKVSLSGPTPGGLTDVEGVTGALLLQDHHNPVQYKNIFFVPKG